ncbi:PDDEXK family nuclease [Sideroxydans sp.]
MSIHAEQDNLKFASGIGASNFQQSINQDIWLKHKHQKSAGHSIYIDRELSARSLLYADQLPTFAEMAVRRSLFEQVDLAFSKEPTLSGVIDGCREIKLGKRGGGRASYFPSKKNAKSGLPAVAIPVESRAESAFALELERNPSVQAFRTQALALDIPGSNHPIYPDFLYVDTGGRLHVREVKANKEYLSSEFRERIEVITGILHKEGISYAVVDLNDMPSGMKSANLFWLHKQYDRIPHMDEIKAFFALDFERSTYGELQELCRSNGLPASLVPYLLMCEWLQTNWKCRIDNLMEVWK